MNLGFTVACVGLLLLVLGIWATYPTAALQQCREAYEQARVTTVEARR